VSGKALAAGAFRHTLFSNWPATALPKCWQISTGTA